MGMHGDRFAWEWRNMREMSGHGGYVVGIGIMEMWYRCI